MFSLGIHDSWHFRHPSLGIICGATFSGKSTWILNFLREKERLIRPKIDRVILVYSEEQPVYFEQLRRAVPSIEFLHGLETAEDNLHLSASLNNLLIIDDLFHEALSSKYFLDLTTKIGHHRSTSILFTTHNLFHQSKYAKTISDQAKYMILFKNTRDVNQIKYLGQQVFGSGGGKILEHVMNDVTRQNNFGYIIIDLHPQSDPQLKLITNVLSHEAPFSTAYLVE
jgi:hypothetical protein